MNYNYGSIKRAEYIAIKDYQSTPVDELSQQGCSGKICFIIYGFGQLQEMALP